MDNVFELMVGDKKLYCNLDSLEKYNNISRITDYIHHSNSDNIDIKMADDTTLLNINKTDSIITIIPLNKIINYKNYGLWQHAINNNDGLYEKLQEAFRVIKRNCKITYIDKDGDRMLILVKKTRWMRIFFISIFVILVILGIAFAVIRK